LFVVYNNILLSYLVLALIVDEKFAKDSRARKRNISKFKFLF